jgi:hypothetical protein
MFFISLWDSKKIFNEKKTKLFIASKIKKYKILEKLSVKWFDEKFIA